MVVRAQSRMKWLEVPSESLDTVHAMVRSLSLCDVHSKIDGFTTHVARHATVQAAESIGHELRDKALKTHQLESRTKRSTRAPPLSPRAVPTEPFCVLQLCRQRATQLCNLWPPQLRFRLHSSHYRDRVELSMERHLRLLRQMYQHPPFWVDAGSNLCTPFGIFVSCALEVQVFCPLVREESERFGGDRTGSRPSVFVSCPTVGIQGKFSCGYRDLGAVVVHSIGIQERAITASAYRNEPTT